MLNIILISATDNVETYGSWQEADKHGNAVTIEWHRLTHTIGISQNLKEQVATICEEAFGAGDNEQYFLLDETFNMEFNDNTIISADQTNIMQKQYETFILTLNTMPHDLSDPLLARYEAIKASPMNFDTKSRIERTKECFQRSPAFEVDQDETKFLVVAKDATQNTLGCVIFAKKPNNVIELDPLAVLPFAQGRGLAKLLVFSILTLEPETKIIHLGTPRWNTKSQAVYKKLGFKENGRYGYCLIFDYMVSTNVAL